MTRKAHDASPIHLKIGRIAIDAEALGDVSRTRLRADVGTALSLYLSGQAVGGPPTLAQQIAGSVAPEVRAQLPKGGRNGA